MLQQKRLRIMLDSHPFIDTIPGIELLVTDVGSVVPEPVDLRQVPFQKNFQLVDIKKSGRIGYYR